MAKDADAKRDVYGILAIFKEIKKSKIDNILENNGYSVSSKVKKESIARSRRNVVKDMKNGGFVVNIDDKYVATDKLKKIITELKVMLEGNNSDIRNVVTKLNKITNNNNNNNDRTMGFVTQYSLNSSFLENSIIEAKVRDCTLFLSLLSKMLEDDEEKKAS